MRTSVLALAASDKDISQATNVGNALRAIVKSNNEIRVASPNSPAIQMTRE